MSTPIRHTYTEEQIAAIADAINGSTTPIDLLHNTIDIVYRLLLAADPDINPSEARVINMHRYAIPAVQWSAILHAASDRAQPWGMAVHIAVDLSPILPPRYDDPGVPDPKITVRRYDPLVHHIDVTLPAAQVIAAANAYIDRLAAFYGQDSRYYLDAVGSWQRHLSAVFSLACGTANGSRTRVHRHRPLSLLVQTSSGVLYELTWNGQLRLCRHCGATVTDDGAADGGNPDCGHEPSYPVDGPEPGTWTFKY
ncbi:hypothetical protein GCM10010123_19660 [Pilimelia anulata]|uniref:Uncharacterized protein n=1 Tax=Pilimelia anulata TaxID=53371 RepID=A0A8J3B6Y4_9ACTN|nr:hypothetical protein [Pilimelia anulata]GGJ89905.1 hypothetical protein GCM10010123_19660 [Pilimelia anulata]